MRLSCRPATSPSRRSDPSGYGRSHACACKSPRLPARHFPRPPRRGRTSLLHSRRGGTSLLLPRRGRTSLLHRRRGGTSVLLRRRGGTSVLLLLRGWTCRLLSRRGRTSLVLPLPCSPLPGGNLSTQNSRWPWLD